MRLSRFIAAGFGTGYAPVAAGTVASAAAVVSGVAMTLLSPWLLPLAALAACIGGYGAVQRAHVEGDPGWVVIDEFAGQWITLLALPHPTFVGAVAAFLLFRIFDITKLGPIGWADRQHGPFGIMADDIIAGVVSAIIIALARYWRLF
jgi:phosphatidylglycerophosphatase A